MKYHWLEANDANFYTIVKDRNWFAVVQLNGELSTPQQKAIMDDLVEALNGQ
jgi:hypothetical protein